MCEAERGRQQSERPVIDHQFIEYNWHLPAIPGSFDQALKGVDQREHIPFDLAGLFDFSRCNAPAVTLDPASGQVDLRGANLSDRNLQRANLSGALLTNANVSSSNLFGAFLENAVLKGADLRNGNESNADFTNANLQGVNFFGSNLSQVGFRHADLTGAHLQAASLFGAVWSDTICPDGTNSDADGGSCVNHF